MEVSDKPLLRVIENLGGWPVTSAEWNPDNAIDLEILVAVIKRNFTLGVLIEEWVGPDDRNSENHIIQVSKKWTKQLRTSIILGLISKIRHFGNFLKFRELTFTEF